VKRAIGHIGGGDNDLKKFAGLSGYMANSHFKKAMLCGTLIVP